MKVTSKVSKEVGSGNRCPFRQVYIIRCIVPETEISNCHWPTQPKIPMLVLRHQNASYYLAAGSVLEILSSENFRRQGVFSMHTIIWKFSLEVESIVTFPGKNKN